MEQNNNKEITENFGLTEKAIDVLQEIEHDLNSIYEQLFNSNSLYDNMTDKLTDIANNIQNIM